MVMPCLAYQTGVDRRGRPEATIMRHWNMQTLPVVGPVFTEHGVSFVLPDSKHPTHRIFHSQEFVNGAKTTPNRLV